MALGKGAMAEARKLSKEIGKELASGPVFPVGTKRCLGNLVSPTVALVHSLTFRKALTPLSIYTDFSIQNSVQSLYGGLRVSPLIGCGYSV